MKRFLIMLIIVSFVLSLVSVACTAEEKYPNKPVTFIVTSGAGGMTDASSRILADTLKRVIGQPIAVVNKPGGGGLVGLNTFIANKVDPYSVCVTVTCHLNAAPFLSAEKLDLDKLSFVGSYMPQERILFAQMDAPYESWEEFVAYVKENPGKVSAGSGNNQWALEVIKSIAVKEGLDMNFVRFKSGAEGSNAIIGGHVDVCETGVGTPAYQAARAGKLRIILNLGSGMQAGVPESVRQYWENALRVAMEDYGVIEKFIKLGLIPRYLPGKQWKEVAINDCESVYALLDYNKELNK
jgi:tripartite-type tricarboxylate transporter receptor subunit TctC